MSLSSDNFTALIYLRDQARKWKNIAFIVVFISVLMVTKLMFRTDEVTNSSANAGKDYIANISIEGMIFGDEYRSKIGFITRRGCS